MPKRAAPSRKPRSSILTAFGLRSSWRRRPRPPQNEEPRDRRLGFWLLTALTWFEFPGHTWLQQDTQIYAPVLEHLRDPAVLRRDILVASPQVSFTLYDEIARGLRAITGLGFREILEGLQIATRALGIWGVYLMAAALGLSAPASMLVAGIISLGATIGGPAVLSFEIRAGPPRPSPYRCSFWRWA